MTGKREVTYADRPCALKSCGVVFTPANGRQRFHTVECRQEAARLGPSAVNKRVYGNKAARSKGKRTNGQGARASAVRAGRAIAAAGGDFLEVLSRDCDRELMGLDAQLAEIERKRSEELARVEQKWSKQRAAVVESREEVARVKDALAVKV